MLPRRLFMGNFPGGKRNNKAGDEPNDWLSGLLVDRIGASGGSAEESDGVNRNFTIVTWNIWFSPHRWRERLAAALSETLSHDPSVFCYQEVTTEAHRAMIRCEYLRHRYHPTEDRLPWSYDCSIWVRRGASSSSSAAAGVGPWSIRSVRSVPLPSVYGRRGLFVDLESAPGAGGGAARVRVATSHLESGRAMGPTRRAQLEDLFSRIRDDPFGGGRVGEAGGGGGGGGPSVGIDAAFLVGDFNLDPSYDENELVERSGTDLWSQLRPSEPGHTEDTRINAMRYAAKGVHKRVRYDRIVMVEPSDDGGGRGHASCSPMSIEMLGTESFDAGGETWVSDHFGLVARVRLSSDDTNDS